MAGALSPSSDGLDEAVAQLREKVSDPILHIEVCRRCIYLYRWLRDNGHSSEDGPISSSSRHVRPIRSPRSLTASATPFWCASTSLCILKSAAEHAQTSLLRALDPARTPCILFPAMNTLMYTHPLTAPQLATAKDVIGYEVIGPISKTIACGDTGASSSPSFARSGRRRHLRTGIGGMTEWKDIVQLVVDRYKLKRRPPT